MVAFAKRIIEGPTAADKQRSADAKKSSGEKSRAAFARKRSVGKLSGRKGSMSGTRTVKDPSEDMELTNPFKYGSDIENEVVSWGEEEKEPAQDVPLVAADVTRDLKMLYLGDATMTLSNQRLFEGEISPKSPKVQESPMKMFKKD